MRRMNKEDVYLYLLIINTPANIIKMAYYCTNREIGSEDELKQDILDKGNAIIVTDPIYGYRSSYIYFIRKIFIDENNNWSFRYDCVKMNPVDFYYLNKSGVRKRPTYLDITHLGHTSYTKNCSLISFQAIN